MPTKTFLSHNTALAYWRYHFPLDSELGLPAHVSDAEECASSKADVLGSIPEEFVIPDHPVDVMVFNDAYRRRSNNVECHAWQTFLPNNAFYRVRGVYVSSPEFVFLQMALTLPIEQLIALGCELCGQYVMLPEGFKHPGSLDEMPKRLCPLTSTSNISTFLEAVGKVKGKAKAKRALKYVVDGSRSPMETMVYMLLCLPVLLGGYGLPKPEMNATIQLDDEARAIAHRSYCLGDLCWPDYKLDVEYHGKVHVGAMQMKSDIGRELGIEHMGWQVVTITSPQVLDPGQFETVVKEVAAKMRKRLRASVFQATAQRNTLRQLLEQWMLGA